MDIDDHAPEFPPETPSDAEEEERTHHPNSDR